MVDEVVIYWVIFDFIMIVVCVLYVRKELDLEFVVDVEIGFEIVICEIFEGVDLKLVWIVGVRFFDVVF